MMKYILQVDLCKLAMVDIMLYELVDILNATEMFSRGCV